MAKTIVHNGKTYLMVESIGGGACEGCALYDCSQRCPRDGEFLACASPDNKTDYILIEDTPEARAEHFALKVSRL